LISETRGVAHPASFKTDRYWVTRFRRHGLVGHFACTSSFIEHSAWSSLRSWMLCSDVSIVFGNIRYMPLALDSRAEACKMMQRGSSTVQLRRKRSRLSEWNCCLCRYGTVLSRVRYSLFTCVVQHHKAYGAVIVAHAMYRGS
jgi:hypothetical protein